MQKSVPKKPPTPKHKKAIKPSTNNRTQLDGFFMEYSKPASPLTLKLTATL